MLTTHACGACRTIKKTEVFWGTSLKLFLRPALFDERLTGRSADDTGKETCADFLPLCSTPVQMPLMKCVVVIRDHSLSLQANRWDHTLSLQANRWNHTLSLQANRQGDVPVSSPPCCAFFTEALLPARLHASCAKQCTAAPSTHCLPAATTAQRLCSLWQPR